MAIKTRCKNCRGYSDVTAKVCRTCGEPFRKDDRKYRVDVVVKGNRVFQFTHSLALAREIETRLRSDLLRGEFDIIAHKKQKTLADVWGKYLPWAQANKRTWADDDYNYRKHLEPRFGNKTLDSITPFEIEKMKLDLKKGLNKRGKPYSPATIKHQIVLLRRLFNQARKWHLYDGKNPVDHVSLPRLDNQVTEFLTDDEADRLLKVLEEWPCRDSADFVRFAMLTGLRRGELFRLMWDDVDFTRGLVTIREPKGGKTTTIPVADEAIAVLRGRQITSPYVFHGKNGKQRADFKGPWERIRQAAHLPAGFRFHGLRHNFASQLVSNGVDLAIVRELLTHKDMTTTQRYAHLRPDAIQDAARKAGRLIVRAKAHVIELTI